MGIKFVLTDIDGTLTAVDETGGMARSITEHFRDMAGPDAVPFPDKCITCSLEKYNISKEEFTQKLLADLSLHTQIRPDAAAFLKFCKNTGFHLYTATTNSKYAALLKLSLGGITEDDYSGFFGGDAFGDPLGKGSPAFFPAILQALQCDGSDVAMVGDEPEFDLYPARKAGIKTIIIVDLKQKEDVCQKNGAYYVRNLNFAREIIQNAQ